MMQTLEVPEILNIPQKLMPIVTKFNDYRFFLLEGGRGSGKSHSVARLLLYLGKIRKLRIVCTRENQNSLADSVYNLICDTNAKFQLGYYVTKTYLECPETGTTIVFKGCKEQGKDNIKSLEKADIVWCEEAQSMTEPTLQTLIPTVRTENNKMFFSMNRFVRNDPVYENMMQRENCLHIHIDYFENEFCPASTKEDAEFDKKNNPKDYNHIWLGEPLATTTDYLFNMDKLAKMPNVQIHGALYQKQIAVAIDFAAGGGDLCVAQVMERVTGEHWQVIDTIRWADPDTDISVGKSIAIYGKYQPDVFVVDAGGVGYPMFCTISKTIKTVIGFDGSKTDNKTPTSANNRAGGYFALKEYIDNEQIICHEKQTIKQLETIKKKYKSNGDILIQSKIDMKSEGIPSPDDADALMMCVWGIKYRLGRQTAAQVEGGYKPEGMRTQKVACKRKKI